MKKFCLTSITLLSVILAFGQQDATNTELDRSKLLNVKEVVKMMTFHKLQWTLASYNDIQHQPTSAEYVISEIDNFLSIIPTEGDSQEKIAEFYFLKKYRDNIDKLFQELQFFGGQSGAFIYDKKIDTPVHFCTSQDSSLVVLISSVFIEDVYNTLRLTSKQRATKVITTYILNSLASFEKSFSETDIDYYGISCIYGSRNFVEDNSFRTKPEVITFIASAELIKKYIDWELTEDELVEAADIFISDRDMLMDVKKIKINIE